MCMGRNNFKQKVHFCPFKAVRYLASTIFIQPIIARQDATILYSLYTMKSMFI